MKRLLVLLFIPFLSYAQIEVEAPTIDKNTGFYTHDFKIGISHTDAQLTLLYTLDGSEPKIENLSGKEWTYKTDYPIQPGDPFGELLKDTLWTYEYTDSIQIEDKSNEFSIINHIATSVKKNGSYSNGKPFRGMVVRAVAYDAVNQVYSEIITRYYYITPEGNNRYSLPITSIGIDNNELFGYEEGINVPGKTFDDWRIDHPNSTDMYWAVPGNYSWSGDETEKRMHISYLDSNKVEKINQNGGLRLNGNTTTTLPIKSFRLYAKKDYGKKTFKHEFFDDYQQDDFKRLILRNGGNETGRSIFKDAFLHNAVRNLNMNIQEYRPTILFINGEYNGIRTLRERYDKKYFDYKWNVDEDSLDFIKVSLELEAKEGDSLYYNEMLNFLRNNDLSSESNYSQAIQYLDPINYTDYFITNIFAVNTDWLANNYQCWRKRVDYNPNAPYGQDGRFRWNLQDLDISLGYSENYTYKAMAWATKQREETSNKMVLLNNAALVINSLLKNDAYKNYFLNRFADLLNTTFLESRMTEKLDFFQSIYQEEFPEHRQRWFHYSLTLGNWNNLIGEMREFLEKRPTYQRDNLIDFFHLDGKFDLVLNVNDENQGYIHLNSIDILPTTDGIENHPYLWIGEYFKGVPITAKAIAKPGYKFSHWSGVSNATTDEITITLNEDSYLKAHFVVDPTSGIGEIEANEQLEVILYPNPAKDHLRILSEIDLTNGDFTIFSTEGKMIQSGILTDINLSISDLENGNYFIRLVKDNLSVTKRFIKE